MQLVVEVCARTSVICPAAECWWGRAQSLVHSVCRMTMHVVGGGSAIVPSYIGLVVLWLEVRPVSQQVRNHGGPMKHAVVGVAECVAQQ